jgi:Phage tail lysozyme
VSAAAHGKERKIRRTGRHAAPNGARKAVRRAGKAAPVFAVAGALAAVPQVRDLVAGARAPAAHTSADKLAYGDDLGAEMVRTASRSLAHVKTGAAAGGHAAGTSPAAARPASPPASATPAVPASPSPAASPAGLHCSASATGMLPDNYATIVTFLVAHGYSDNAAAGIAGNIYQESHGDPESEGDGGGGLIGWTPLPAGLVTGNAAADLQAQLTELLSFDEQWSQYLPALNDASTPAAAAGIYVTDFERAGVPAAGTREEAADAVAQACGF